MTSPFVQTALLPAGCQPWNRHVVAASDTRYAYCSTLAIYIHNARTHELERVITGVRRTITSLTWSPHNPDLIATTSLDNRIAVWNVTNEREMVNAKTQEFPMCVDWSPTDPNLILYATNKGTIVVWNHVKREQVQLKDLSSVVRVVRWNPSRAWLFAVGTSEGQVILYDGTAKKARKMSFKSDSKNPSSVTDIQWDPLSASYLLVSYRSGKISLYDTDSETEVHSFDPPSGGVRNLRWIPGVPGGFMSTDSRTGVLRLWNVSQGSPISVVKVHKAGFHDTAIIPSSAGSKASQRAVCTFQDGTVGVYDVAARRWESKSEGGHTETIFTCEWNPTNPDVLATGSYDGQVRLWDVTTMKCVNNWSCEGGVIYSLAFSADGKRLAGATSSGKVYIWDTARGSEVLVMHHHRLAVYSVVWNPSDASCVASCSRDGTTVIASAESGRMRQRYKHSKGCFGASWSPTQPNLLAVGCHEGVAKVYDTNSSSDAPIRIFKGHKDRVFNVKWSPLLPGVFCSGSDDRTIRIWNMATGVDTGATQVLEGHTNNVRALSWNHEIPWLLITGSWDATIRLWDIRDGKCLKVMYDHHADVYALVAHPSRPFVYASTSRDTTMRLWSAAGVAGNARLAVSSGTSWGDVIATGAKAKAETMKPGAATVLSGAKSALLAAGQSVSGDPIERARQSVEYWMSPTTGARELLDQVEVMATGSATPAGNRVVALKDLVAEHTRRAKNLTALKMGVGGNEGTRAERLAKAADQYLMIGNIREACEVFVELGLWDRALAVAPGVSIEYWRELGARRSAAALEASGGAPTSDSIVGWAVAGEPLSLAQCFKRADRLDEAAAVTQAVVDGCISTVIRGDERSSLMEAAEGLQAELTNSRAEKLFQRASPMLSAAVHLAAKDVGSALSRLLAAAEVEMSIQVCKLLNTSVPWLVAQAASRRAERHKAWKVAADWAHQTQEGGAAVAEVVGRFPGSDEERKAAFHGSAGANVPPPASFLDSAAVALKKGDKIGAVRGLVLGGALDQAVNVGLEALSEMFAGPNIEAAGVELGAAAAVVEALASGRLTEHGESAERKMVLAYGAYIGFMRASWRGFGAVIPALFRTTRHLIDANSLKFPVSEQLMRLQYATAMEYVNEKESKAAADDILGDPDAPEAIKAGAKAVKERLARTSPGEVARGGMVVTEASHLPAGTNRRHAVMSIATNKQVQGPEWVLEDGKSAMSWAEALMWSRVNPFSPLGTGARLSAW